MLDDRSRIVPGKPGPRLPRPVAIPVRTGVGNQGVRTVQGVPHFVRALTLR